MTPGISPEQALYRPVLLASAPRMHFRGDVLGVITGRDVLRHPVTIVRCFGPAAYVRCVRAALSGRPVTFLETIRPVGFRQGGSRGVLWRALALSLFVAVGAGAGAWLLRSSDAPGCGCESSYSATA